MPVRDKLHQILGIAEFRPEAFIRIDASPIRGRDWGTDCNGIRSERNYNTQLSTTLTVIPGVMVSKLSRQNRGSGKSV